MPERHVVRRIRRLAEMRGARVIKVVGDPDSIQEVGISDFLICYRGLFVAMEVKQSGGRVAPIQSRFLQSVRDAGGIGVVVQSATEAEAVFDEIDRTR